MKIYFKKFLKKMKLFYAHFFTSSFSKRRQIDRYIAFNVLLNRIVNPPSQTCLDLSLYELSIFSQNGEDGVLQEIFRRIGTKNSEFVEIGAHPNESNCIFLADVLGWKGVFYDASKKHGSALQAKYKFSELVRVKKTFVAPDDINQLFQTESLRRDFDLLSIDIDGNDYWIWDSLTHFEPRVVVIEYNSYGNPKTPKISEYSNKKWDGTSNFGSSLLSLVELGKKKGYQLVHAETTGCNLFFVRTDQLSPFDFLDEQNVTSRVTNYFLFNERHLI